MTTGSNPRPTDRAWIKALAEASLAEGAWRLKDPDAVKRRASDSLLSIVTDLFEMMADAAEVFNLHRSTIKPLRVLPWQPEGANAARGFIVFSGAVQLKLEQRADFYLEESVVAVRDYQRHPKKLHAFAPHIDNFGGLTWIMDKRLTMTPELIIKQLLKDICIAVVGAGRK